MRSLKKLFLRSYFSIINRVPSKWGKVLGRRRPNMVRFPFKYPKEKCGIFEVKTKIRTRKISNSKTNFGPVEKPSPINRRIFTMGLAMCPWLRPFLASLYAFFENKKRLGKLAKIVDYELKSGKFPWGSRDS